MGRLDIIDSLVDNRVNEGMITTLDKSKGLEELQKALTRRDLTIIPNQHIKPSVEYFSKSFNNMPLNYIVDGGELPSHNGKSYYIYHLADKGIHYIMLIVTREDVSFRRCVIQRCDTADVADTIWDYVDRKALAIVDVRSEFKGCKIVADTFISGLSNKSVIFKDTDDVMKYMFYDSVRFLQIEFRSAYDSFVEELVSSCHSYTVSVDKNDTFTLGFSFNTRDDNYKVSDLCKKALGRTSTDTYGIVLNSFTSFSIEFYY
jgi:hypothetical protein